jgi:uncharacterized repeat protein (TIGR04076 family)
MSTGRIRILKRMVNQDIIDQYQHQTVVPCPVFAHRKEFVVEDWSTCPDNFCEWAWSDIQKKIELAHKLRTVVACCTDGFRPVVFEIQIDSIIT